MGSVQNKKVSSIFVSLEPKKKIFLFFNRGEVMLLVTAVNYLCTKIFLIQE